MYCPNCQNLCGENDTFCFRCGVRLSETKPPKRGTHWIPLLILTLLSTIGICLFFLMPMNEASDPAPSVPAAEHADTPWFSVENGILSFDPAKYTGGSELTVPEIVNGQTVKVLSAHCFRDCDTLTTVILPDSLLVIGVGAFEGCTSIRGIFIPEGVHTIGRNAFSGCTALEAVTIPATVTTIETAAFKDCESLLHIFYNGSVSSWRSLYDEKITLRTQVYCTDGNHLQR